MLIRVRGFGTHAWHDHAWVVRDANDPCPAVYARIRRHWLIDNCGVRPPLVLADFRDAKALILPVANGLLGAQMPAAATEHGSRKLINHARTPWRQVLPGVLAGVLRKPQVLLRRRRVIADDPQGLWALLHRRGGRVHRRVSAGGVRGL